ncbi:uncharacterized protein BP5553_07553 [Venustampulla echinocandica]|uniref:Secreted protein n=1 Tax=Venustampulla echinocandica TaxID=2656787 RepID=A0A370TGV0_9HELO|nr:uncharacterized protein BP5553_07553 [Venustampulla echinocandica]RDL34425.1 hypothetical protein BP5553_07553 [Venustampulla echinocandica]
MQFFTIVLSLVGLLTLALGAAVQNDLPYPLVPFEYTGALGGHEVQLNGTVQDIFAQMKELHPDFDVDTLPDSSVGNNANDIALDSRDVASKHHYFCWPVKGQTWERANTNVIADGINYLRKMNICNVGGQSCVRISCSYRGAIFLCNDNPDTIYPRCPYIASYASDISKNCLTSGPFNARQTCGQEFDTDGYNVIVRAADC